MPQSRDVAQISATSLEDALAQLNFILQRFNDRLDKLEGLRDQFETEGGATVAGYASVYDGEDLIHGFGEEG